jgi:hypothetical protein
MALDKIVVLEGNYAKPFWAPETTPLSSVYLETDFYLDTEFREGQIRFSLALILLLSISTVRY